MMTALTLIEGGKPPAKPGAKIVQGSEVKWESAHTPGHWHYGKLLRRLEDKALVLWRGAHGPLEVISLARLVPLTPERSRFTGRAA